MPSFQSQTMFGYSDRNAAERIEKFHARIESVLDTARASMISAEIREIILEPATGDKPAKTLPFVSVQIGAVPPEHKDILMSELSRTDCPYAISEGDHLFVMAPAAHCYQIKLEVENIPNLRMALLREKARMTERAAKNVAPFPPGEGMSVAAATAAKLA